MVDLCVSFSGGRTSAYMCKWLIDNTFDILNLANTDFEKFIDSNYEECAEECGSVFPE